MTQIVQAVPVRPKRSPYIAAAAFFLLLVVVGVVALVPKLRHREDLRTEAAAAGGPPVVLATRLVGGEKNSRIELPASIQAFAQTTIFARTSGYIKQRYVDIGDHVRKGQLLAVIEDPQTDQQLLQARATLAQTRAQLLQAQANAELSGVTNERWQSLQKAGVVAMQDADQKRAQSSADAAAVAAAKANIAANEANVASLTEQASFERVTAPFAGIILSRSIDTGSLISVGSQNSVQQMFTWHSRIRCGCLPMFRKRIRWGFGRARRRRWRSGSWVGRCIQGRSRGRARVSTRERARCWWRST